MDSSYPESHSNRELVQALAESEERFRLLVSCVQDYAIFMLGLDGRVSSWNAGAERIKGYSSEEIIDRHFSIFYTSEDVALGLPESELETTRRVGRYETEGWRVRKDGSHFRAHVVITPLRDNSGSLCGFAKVTRDVSAYKQFEERFRRVVESAPNAMVMINRAGMIEMVNTQAEQMFGYSRTEMLGEPVEILVPERFRGEHRGLRAGFFHAPQSRPMGAGRDLFGRRKDGSEIPIEIGLNPIDTDEGPMVLSAIVDISDRKQKEMHVRAALQEKELLLGEIHHRVKNNLQIVDSLLDMQALRIDDPHVQEILRDSQNRIRSMALIHQTLYQSHDFARVDFAGIVDSLVPTLVTSYGIDASRVSVEIKTDAVHLPINLAIPCGLIINELVTNALKHAFPDGRSGVISLQLHPRDGASVELLVSDNGVGIPEHLNIEQSDTLGLQLVQLLASQVNGELTVCRNPTQFMLTFAVPAVRPVRR